jgi:hypothetical protein
MRTVLSRGYLLSTGCTVSLILKTNRYLTRRTVSNLLEESGLQIVTMTETERTDLFPYQEKVGQDRTNCLKDKFNKYYKHMIKSYSIKKAEMKKMTYLFAALVMVAALGSCQQDDNEIVLKKGNSDEYGMSSPAFMGLTPVVMEGANNGGNVTCAEVAEWFETDI